MIERLGEYGFVLATLVLTGIVATMFVVQINAVNDDSCNMLRLQSVGKTANLLIGQMLKDSAFLSVKQGESLQPGNIDVRKHALLEKIEQLHDIHSGKILFRIILYDGTIICDSSRSKKENQARPLAKITDADLLGKIITTCESSGDGAQVERTELLYASPLNLSGIHGYILLVEIA